MLVSVGDGGCSDGEEGRHLGEGSSRADGEAAGEPGGEVPKVSEGVGHPAPQLGAGRLLQN